MTSLVAIVVGCGIAALAGAWMIREGLRADAPVHSRPPRRAAPPRRR